MLELIKKKAIDFGMLALIKIKAIDESRELVEKICKI